MKTLMKIIFGLLALILVVIVAAVVILPMVIDPNDYKPQIVEAVKQNTGRDLTIQGDIGLSVFPKLGLELGQTELSNAKGFGADAFARVNAVSIRVALMPLLDKEIKMDEIVLQGLALNLKRDKTGTTNWDDLTAKGEPAKDKAAPARQEGAPQIKALAIGGLRIEDANIVWEDAQNDQRYAINNFNLVSGPLIPGKPVEIDLGTDFTSKTPEIQGHTDLSGTIMAGADNTSFTLSDMQLAFSAQGKTLPGGKTEANVKMKSMMLDLKNQTLTIANIQSQLAGLALNAQVEGKQIMGDKPQFSGRVDIPAFNAREVMGQLGQEVPQTADTAALTRVSAAFDFTATPTSVSLTGLKSGLDDTAITGKLAVTDFASSAINFDLDIDQIDLDRYLPPQTAEEKKAAAAAPAASGGEEAELFPVETLRKLNANGTARIGQVKSNNLTATNVVVKLKADSGKIELEPSAKLYQGDYNARVNLDARGKTPNLRVDTKLGGVQIEPLLKDLQGDAKLAGRTDLSANITANGNRQSELKKTLNGNAAFSFTNGALVGVNIAQVIREGMAKFKGKPVPKSNEPNQTDFSELKGTAKITNGLIDNRDFSMKTPLLRVVGEGTANLVSEQLDYLVKASVVGTLEGQGGEELEKLKGLTIPVKVTGPFSQPAYKPDLSAVLSDTAKKKVEEAVDEKKGELEQKLKDKLGDKLKGLF
jgi:AsmA protein